MGAVTTPDISGERVGVPGRPPPPRGGGGEALPLPATGGTAGAAPPSARGCRARPGW